MTLSLGFSPCPNDTFIFDAMIHGRIDTEGLSFDVVMEDVEALNQKALAGDLDITKLSYHAYAYLLDQYALLSAGSALGNGVGPLLVAKQYISPEALKTALIAVPGRYTTAHFLFSSAFPEAKNKSFMVFHDIEAAVLRGEVDAGVIIHENRFTYAEKGLVKIVDLGEFWEKKTGLPIPLGGIVVHRKWPLEVQQKVNRVMARSVAYAFEHPTDSQPFVAAHAQEMSPHVMQQHIDLYVNHFTQNLGAAGRAAVKYMFDDAVKIGLIPPYHTPIFIPE